MSEAIENLSVILLTLRRKLAMVAAVLVAGVALSFQFTGPLIERMKEDLLPEGAKLVYVSPLEVMMLKLKLSFIIGILLALPLIAFYAYRALSRRFSLKNPIKNRKEPVFAPGRSQVRHRAPTASARRSRRRSRPWPGPTTEHRSHWRHRSDRRWPSDPVPQNGHRP